MIKTSCPRCAGRGEVPLPLHLRETLAEVKRTPGFSAPDYLDRFVGITSTAINNRLEELRRLGFVRRERDGNTWRYYPITK